MKYKIIDPDWNDNEPLVEEADTPEEAVAKYYTGTLLEAVPAMFAETTVRSDKVYQYQVTDEDGVDFYIYFS